MIDNKVSRERTRRRVEEIKPRRERELTSVGLDWIAIDHWNELARGACEEVRASNEQQEGLEVSDRVGLQVRPFPLLSLPAFLHLPLAQH